MIAVVMAAYNEAAHLNHVLPRLPRNISGTPVRAVVVCDGSVDGTCSVAAGHGAIVVPLASNQGKWRAVREGINVAAKMGASVLVIMDSDGQHDPAALATLVAPIHRGDADMVVGSRYATSPSRGSAPRNRYLVRVVTVALLGRILRRVYTDPYSGYRAFSAAAIAQMSFRGDRYQGELEALFEAHRLGLRVAEMPVAKIYGTDTSKMGDFHGKFWGRVAVLSQYAGVFARYGLAALRPTEQPPSSRLAA